MSKSRQKGTGGEREVLRAALEHGLDARREPSSSRHDITVGGGKWDFRSDYRPPINALATRPDRGHWLVSIPLHDFLKLLELTDQRSHVEVKRYAAFAHHTIFEGKFGV